MHGVHVENRRINPGVMARTWEAVFRPLFLLLMNQKQQQCVCVNKQRIHHIVMART